MAALITIQYKGIAFSFQNDGWFNATTAAAKYGKRPNDWLALPETKAYIHALNVISNTGQSGIWPASSPTKFVGLLPFEMRPTPSSYGAGYSRCEGVAFHHPLIDHDVQKLDAIGKGLRSVHTLAYSCSGRGTSLVSRQPKNQNLLIAGFGKRGVQ